METYSWTIDQNRISLLDELFKRRLALALCSEIADMKEYSLQWKKLAEDFEAAGCPQNAALCKSNYERYSQEAQ